MNQPSNPGQPQAGHYRMRLARGAVWSAVRIWFGPPPDPLTGELLERSWRWQAEINGEPADIWAAWPACAGERIDGAEFHYLLAVRRWALEHDPSQPEASPRQAVDFNTLDIRF